MFARVKGQIHRLYTENIWFSPESGENKAHAHAIDTRLSFPLPLEPGYEATPAIAVHTAAA